MIRNIIIDIKNCTILILETSVNADLPVAKVDICVLKLVIFDNVKPI